MLESIWFFLWGILWAVYFMLDGYDLGLGTLMPFVAKNDTERKLVYRAMGPHWDGNEVWLITAGGVTFAAFPTTYAAMFSGLYSALMLVLFALILRGVSFVFRNEVDSPGWKRLWDACLFLGSFLPAVLLGVAFANIFRGLPIGEGGLYQGGLLTLINPYGLAGGVLFLLLFLVHGALWLAVKSEGALHERATAIAAKLWWPLLVVAALFLFATSQATRLFENYAAKPVLLLIPALAVAALVMVYVYMRRGAWWRSWFASAITIVAVTLFGVVGLYPNLLPSSLDPAHSLTISNSASSPLTLKIMLGVALTFVPIVIAYQAWAHLLFKDKAREEDLAAEEGY
ncbi:MAG: cytochrome d ubiquinol oxidase subunit II [Deltaproteobacteria bacterium]|nr:cytochrome d ubiquinol oxidase subunit II [Deltaproteobacteria bacterium]